MITQQLLTQHQSQYYAWLLTRRAAGDTVESLASTLVDSQVDLNPHQVEAALFACSNPLSRGVILADEVGLGKTIEAGLVISQRWAERRRRILIIVPANLRKQWHQELQDKFSLQGLILEAKNYNTIRKQERQNPFLMASGPVICSYQFAKSKADNIINYDLPWNPQRIEQRIGRCHRYGQKFDVVVVNFVDRSNEADARVYELLAQKFQLFEGVFGASDEVLGAIGSGVDFERRIADIYQNCRDPDAIKASFEQLQLDLSGEISEAMVKTRQILLENFDEEVQDKLRVRAEDSRAARSKYERMLMDLTRAELADCATFDADGFVLQSAPEPGFSQAGIYILVGNAAEETIYIGEADPVGDRLKNHVSNKEGWVWGVYFFDRNHKIGKTEVQYLESALVALAKKHDRAILLNKNNPTAPTMAPAAKATAQAFLADMLLILPMLGINAFTPPKQDDPSDQVQPVGSESDKFDTIVVPAREEGFKQRFLNEHCWFAVRINAKHISKLKFIAAYQVAPVAAIIH